MSRRHADNWSHLGHYLVDPYTWPWSPNGEDHIWPWKFKYQGHGQGQTHWGLEFKSICLLLSHGNRTTFGWDIANFIFDLENSRSMSRPRSNLMVTFEAWSSIDVFAFRFVAIWPFWQRYSQFHTWPWQFKVGVMAKFKPDGHIWGLEIKRYVCFSFRANRTIFCWDIFNSIFDLENSRSRSWPRSNLMVPFEA